MSENIGPNSGYVQTGLAAKPLSRKEPTALDNAAKNALDAATPNKGLQSRIIARESECITAVIFLAPTLFPDSK